MSQLKYIVKLLIAYVLFYSGVLNLYRRLFFQDRTIVLMYHRILPVDNHMISFSHDGIIVHDDTFKKQVEFLNRHFTMLDINDFSTYNSRFNGTACLITFDDGWSDNYHYAFPILKENNTPAHIFLPINYISNSNNFWQEKLGQSIYHMCNYADIFHSFLSQYELTNIVQYSTSVRKNLIREFVSTQKQLSPDEIKSLIDEFDKEMSSKSCPAPVNAVDTYMTWADVHEMSKYSISFGSHAVSHHVLTRLPVQQLEHELATSKAIIESKINQSIDSIAYPNGNHDKIVCDTTRAADYKMGFTTEPGFVSPSTNPYRIPRINIHEDMTRHMPLFYCRILGLF